MSALRVEHLAEGVTMMLGDSLEIVPTLGAVDHVIGDPPYEDVLHAAFSRERLIRTDGRKGGTMQELGFAGIDDVRLEHARQAVEASTGWVIFFCLAEGVMPWRDALQAAGAKYDTALAWIKPDASPRFNGQGAARGFECAVTAWAGTGHKRWNGGGRRGVFTHCVNQNRQGEHPTEKPVPLMAELVDLYTNEDELVLDPFAGSGTTGIACVKAGRRFVGIEQDPKWFDLACRRIADTLRRPDMFTQSRERLRQAPLFAKEAASS